MWSAQLMPSYTAATTQPDGPAIALSGVAIEAGPSTLTAPARVLSSFSDLDWLAHNRLNLTGSSETIAAMPYFFSYLAKSWALNSKSGPVTASAMPAYPNLGELDMAALIMPEPLKKGADGESMVDKVNHYCWTAKGLTDIVKLTDEYKTKPYLVKDIASGPTVDGLPHGNLDRICAGTPSKGIAKWCAWLTFNNLGALSAPAAWISCRNGITSLRRFILLKEAMIRSYTASHRNPRLTSCLPPRTAKA